MAPRHERAVDDGSILIGDLHCPLFQKVHAVAGVVELEGEVTLEQHLRTQYTDQLIDEGIVAPIEHRHLRGCGDAKDKGVARRANGNGPLTLRTRPACTL